MRLIKTHRPLVGMLALVLITSTAAFASDRPPSWTSHIEQASELDHPLAVPAAEFMADHAPPRDANIDVAILNENLQLALRAREEFAWSSDVPDRMFFNNVVPYASLDEARERWRPALYAISRQIVRDATTPTEAAQRLNQHLFKTVGVHYHTDREKSNQSPFESMRQGRATCTGLSILLVNACRSVGIPARIAGVAEWTSTPGNHTWVEIWDGEAWRYTGADEFDPNGLDRAWFTDRAATSIIGSEDHAVWASSWEPTGAHFPLSWNRADRTVPGIDVTARYTHDVEPPTPDDGSVTRFFRVWDRADGERVVATISIHSTRSGRRETLTTLAGRNDLNDMPSTSLPAGATVPLDIRTEQVALRTHIDISKDPTGIIDLHLDELTLSEGQSRSIAESLIASRQAALKTERATEIADQSITRGEHTLRYLQREFGEDEASPRPLWISMHGGGGAPPEVNDRQWRNQIELYEPSEGVYVAPRAPTDTWNLWHQAHIDPLFDRLIENMIVSHNVDPNRVYLMGYSAGGDGVYQLAPRMADRFAAASMMAGHPNEAKPLGLRNLPFAIFMGADDNAYARNEVALQWGEELQRLRDADPEGYKHRVSIYPGLGHWMARRDAEALPWMLEHTRDPWPKRVVWHQDDVLASRFYWLEIMPEDAEKGQIITAEVRGQTISINTDPDAAPARLTLRLSDDLLDLDLPITVSLNADTVFEGLVVRTRAAIEHGLSQRFDPSSIATAILVIEQQ